MAKDMSKLAAELKKCGETLVYIAEVLAAAQNETTQEPKLEEPVKQYSLEDVRAVLAKRDNYFCYDCIFCSRCSEYKGQSPFGERCYTTIFEVESETYE